MSETGYCLAFESTPSQTVLPERREQGRATSVPSRQFPRRPARHAAHGTARSTHQLGLHLWRYLPGRGQGARLWFCLDARPRPWLCIWRRLRGPSTPSLHFIVTISVCSYDVFHQFIRTKIYPRAHPITVHHCRAHNRWISRKVDLRRTTKGTRRPPSCRRFAGVHTYGDLAISDLQDMLVADGLAPQQFLQGAFFPRNGARDEIAQGGRRLRSQLFWRSWAYVLVRDAAVTNGRKSQDACPSPGSG
jgi:hypothetical protein